jgi:hypothetical protein
MLDTAIWMTTGRTWHSCPICSVVLGELELELERMLVLVLVLVLVPVLDRVLLGILPWATPALMGPTAFRRRLARLHSSPWPCCVALAREFVQDAITN